MKNLDLNQLLIKVIQDRIKTLNSNLSNYNEKDRLEIEEQIKKSSIELNSIKNYTKIE